MRRLDQYQIRVGDDLGDPDFWNRRLEDVDLRLHGQELIEKDWQSAVRELQENGLRRIDEAVSPLIAQLQEDLQLGAVFIAESKSAIEVKTGPLTIGISSANKRRYSPAAYLALVTRDAPYAVMLGRLISYNRDTGTLAVDVERTFGAGEPIRANWIVSATSHIDYQADRVYREAGGGLTSTTVEDALREILSLAVPKTRSLTAGTGMTGGGQLAGDITLSLDLQYTDVRYVQAQAFERHRHNWADIDSRPTSLSGYGIGDAFSKTEINDLLSRKQSKLDYTAEDVAKKGKADGYAPLGPDGKIAGAYLPVDGSFLGVYDAAANTPAIASGSGNQGDFWVVSVAGMVAADGVGAVSAGDQLRRGPAKWERVPTFNAVSSVAGKTGVITLNAGDISDSGAAGRALLKAGDMEAAKRVLSLAVADLSDFSTAWTAAYAGLSSLYGRTLVASEDANAARVWLQLGTAALQVSTAFAPAGHVGAGGVAAHPDATATVSGFMSAADKSKLSGVAANANNYVHPTGDGNLHVPATGTGSARKVLTAGSSAGSMTWTLVDFGDVTGKPDTLAGYGIADAYSRSTVDAMLSGKQPSFGYTAENIGNKGAANGYASLDGGGKIPTSQLPALAIVDTSVVASQAAMLGLVAQRGDVAIRTDLSRSYILRAEPASTLANWEELRTPTDVVQSVAGRQGAVTLASADLTDATALGRSIVGASADWVVRAAIGLGNVNNTSDADKPVSNATASALSYKADKTDVANQLGQKADRTSLDSKLDANGGNIAGIRSMNGAPLGRWNWIVNGNFDVWQRAYAQTSAGYGSDDRWTNNHSGSSKTHSLQAFTPGQIAVPGNPRNFSRTVVSSIAGAGNNCLKMQRIEGVDTLAGRTATLTFYAKADVARPMAFEFVQSFGAGGSPDVTGIGAQKVQLSTAWQKFTATVAIPSLAGKVFGTYNGRLELLFWFDAGSSFNARASGLGQQSGTFDIARVSLVEGDATKEDDAFAPRDPVQELAICQRFFEKSYDIGTAPGSNTRNGVWVGVAINGSNFYTFGASQFLERKRIPPSISGWAPTGASGVLYNLSTASHQGNIGITEVSETRFRLYCANDQMTAGHTFAAHWVADAEI